MKNTITTTLFLIISCTLFTQNQAIKLTKTSNNKEVIIKENKRVKLETTDGRKVTGRINIKNNTIMIDDEAFEIEDIASLKRNTLFLSILTSSFFTYAGGITLGIGTIIGLLADTSAFWLILPGSAMLYTGIKSPNFHRKFINDGTWTIEIIKLNE